VRAVIALFWMTHAGAGRPPTSGWWETPSGLHLSLRGFVSSERISDVELSWGESQGALPSLPQRISAASASVAHCPLPQSQDEWQ
jgi:hypothetical protein